MLVFIFAYQINEEQPPCFRFCVEMNSVFHEQRSF